MFGLSKRERYETRVEVIMAAMLGAGDDGVTFAKEIKGRYTNFWSEAIEEGFKLGNSAEMTGAVFICFFYQEAFKYELPIDQIIKIQTAIICNDHSDNSEFPDRMFFSSLLMSVSDDDKLPTDFKAAWFRDIHRAIFDGDDTHLEDTIKYLITGANDLRAIAKDLRTAVQK